VAVEEGSAPRGVLLFLTGGPGQPGVASATRVLDRLGSALAGYRLVLLDQRGTGARALRCPALQRQLGSSDLAVPTAAAVRACATALGPRRRFFSTEQTVGDLEALRRALGTRTIAIDGVSYGSYVALRYALAHPSRVSRLVLDSVVPQTGVDPLQAASMRAAARVLRAVCAGACPSDPARDAAAVVRRWRAGPALLDALVTTSIVDPSFGGVPDALRAAARGDRALLRQYLAATRPGSIPPELFSQGLHASALCADSPLPWPPSVTARARRQAALRQASARVGAARLWPFDPATAVGNGMAVTCSLWNPTGSSAASDRRRIRVPALLVAGGRDLSTPLEWAREQTTHMPRARIVVVPSAGHSVQMRARSDAGRRAVARFLGRGG
jgi:pimeloyl-ACP methyl ester carboxylesterase